MGHMDTYWCIATVLSIVWQHLWVLHILLYLTLQSALLYPYVQIKTLHLLIGSSPFKTKSRLSVFRY